MRWSIRRDPIRNKLRKHSSSLKWLRVMKMKRRRKIRTKTWINRDSQWRSRTKRKTMR